jgi:hypothetical protein
LPASLKYYKRLFTQAGSGGGSDPTLAGRVTALENNEYKITYYEIVSGASGTLTIPTNTTINAGEFGLSGNAILSKINGSNKVTFETPLTAGGAPVTVTLNTGTGAWTASGVYTDSNVAVIYSLRVSALYLSNLTYDNIIESEELDDISSGGIGLNGVTYTGQYKLNGFFANKSASTAWSGSIYLQPYIITNDHTITEIGAEVTTFWAASNIRLAIYQDNLGEPGALIEDSGDIPADTNGFKSYALASPLALTTSMKVVWLAIQTSTTQIGMRVGQVFNFIGKQTTGTGSDARVRAFTYGAFPNPIGTNANTTFAIAMWVRVQ